MARNLLSVGGKTPQKKAVGLSLSDDGLVNINNPKTNYVLGSIVEPHAEDYQGIVAVMGVDCYASFSANLAIKGGNSLTYGSNVLRVGSKYLIGGNKHLLRYSSNMELLDEVKLDGLATGSSGIRQLMEVGDNICAVSVAGGGFNLETYGKDNLLLKNKIIISAVGSTIGTTRDNFWVSDISHVYVSAENKINKYDANLELVKSSEVNPELANSPVLGIIGNTLIIGRVIGSVIRTIILYDTTTLEQVGVPVELEGLDFRNGFIDGNNFIGVGPNYLTKIDMTNVNNVTVTRLPSELGSTYSTKTVVHSNGLISVVTSSKGGSGSFTTGDILTLLEYDPELGAKRVYQIANISPDDIYKTHIDELDRVWTISKGVGDVDVKLLSSELTLKGYRVIGG